MINVTFVDSKGVEYAVEGRDGASVMETAIESDIPSIVGFCGGMTACGTCHCYPAEEWADRLPPVGVPEADMLARVIDRRAASRLACQIKLNAALNGLVVHLPDRQRVP